MIKSEGQWSHSFPGIQLQAALNQMVRGCKDICEHKKPSMSRALWLEGLVLKCGDSATLEHIHMHYEKIKKVYEIR